MTPLPPRLCHRPRRPGGFTLIELLIVVGIIGLLLQMALPAVQSAREAARQTACRSNLKQLGLAVQLHENARRTLPSGGWHFTWIGEPERGSGDRQPGGWAFSVLDYIEEKNLRNSVLGATSGAGGRRILAVFFSRFNNVITTAYRHG
jgi:prepilin-type N-terminal cleavage/methylation domain-containing protein